MKSYVLLGVMMLLSFVCNAQDDEPGFDARSGFYKKEYSEIGKINMGNSFAKLDMEFKKLIFTDMKSGTSEMDMYVSYIDAGRTFSTTYTNIVSCSEAQSIIQMLEIVSKEIPGSKKSTSFTYLSDKKFEVTIFNSNNEWYLKIQINSNSNSALSTKISKVTELRSILESFLSECK